MDINKLSSQIIGAAIEVHKVLGPGLLESAYEECMCHELNLRDLSFERQKPLSLDYKGIKQIIMKPLRSRRLCGERLGFGGTTWPQT